MKIEILLDDQARKTDVLTHLPRDPGVRAGGNELEVEGLKLEIGESYLLFTITRWERAEEIVPLLFSVEPAHSAHAFRPESGLRALVTALARPIPEIIPELTLVEHLDLEAGELAGEFQVTWTSHDVAITARAWLMVQGGVGVAKIKFFTHARDTEYHCRACVERLSFKEVLGVFCREPLEKAARPEVGPLVIGGRAVVGGDGWSRFINAMQGAPISFDRASGELKLELEPGSYLSFREGKGKGKEVFLHLESAGAFTDALAARAAEMLDLSEVKLHREIRGAALNLDRLRQELGFQLGAGLALLIRAGEFFTTYDAGRLVVSFEARVPLAGRPVQEKLARLGREIEAFTGRVMACVD